jgi:5-methylcytosine-specific restriction endonuclease McrA
MKAAKVLTFDHIIPSFRGGKTTCEVVVAACPPIAFARFSRNTSWGRIARLTP